MRCKVCKRVFRHLKAKSKALQICGECRTGRKGRRTDAISQIKPIEA